MQKHCEINIQARQRHGFTLIELSIVLVIIGLVVGGVLVGRDLIKAASIRAVISQYESYIAAMNTFRTKYNGLPGDIYGSRAATFGLYCCTGNFTTATSNENGLIGDDGSQANVAFGENLVFWRHLYEASLITENLGQGLPSGGGGDIDPTYAPSQYWPVAKLGKGSYFIVGNNGDGNTGSMGFFGLTGIGTIAVRSYGVWPTVLTPIEAFSLDSKIDDGKPNTGKVNARGGGEGDSMQMGYKNPLGELTWPGIGQMSENAASFSAASTANRCMMGGTAAADPANIYNMDPASGGNDASCNLRLRFN